jgi:hypothetical protein
MDLAHGSDLHNNQLVPLATLTSIISSTSTLPSLVFYFCCVHIQIFSFSLPMPWESTLSVILYHHHYYYFGYPNFLYLVNHIIVILPFRSCGSLSCQFCLSTWLLTFYLGHSVCYLCLLCSFGDNFVCCLSLLDQGHCFVVIIYHHLIPLSGICGCRCER